MALLIPIQSARIIPLPPTLKWGQARVPGDTLTAVNVEIPVDVTSYASRDYELAYRDIILAALASEVSIHASDIFGMGTSRISVQGIPAGTFQNNIDDSSVQEYPGVVGHVKQSSIPMDAIQTDRQLYARDVLLYEALARAAAIFEAPPLDSIAPAITLSDSWSLAEGSDKSASVNGSLPLKVDLFKLPDVELTGRDNTVAGLVSRLAYELADVYNRATRLLVQVTDPDGEREPEVYVLKSDDGTNRIFVTSPGMTDRNRVVYDKVKHTVTWLSESYDDHGTVSFSGNLQLTLDDTTLTVHGALPTKADSQFYRQKSARLKFNTYKAVPLYYQPNPVEDVLLSTGAVYQPDGVYLPAPGSNVTFTPPITDGAAHYRLAIYFEPSRISRVFGSLNLNGVLPDNSETATIYTPGFLNWKIKLIEGQYTVRFHFTDLTASPENFEVRAIWNGVSIFDGVVLYGKDPGTFVWSNTYVLSADGEIGSFTIERTDAGASGLTIGTVEFINVRSGNLSCKMTATMGSRTSTSIFSSQSGRPDTLFFDFFDTLPGTITIYLDDVNVGGIYLRALDVRRFGAQRETPNSTGFRLWKRTFIQMALDSVRRSYRESTSSLSAPPQFAVSSVWSTASTDAWMSTLAAVETRIFSAFRVGRPGDVGQPALTPGGLRYDITNRVVVQDDMSDTYPTAQAFQPWMISAGIYVFNEDFWIESIEFTSTINECDFVTADFTAVADTFVQPSSSSSPPAD